VFPDPISAQPATKSVAAAAAKMRMMFDWIVFMDWFGFD
jgi:hypothetical protein